MRTPRPTELAVVAERVARDAVTLLVGLADQPARGVEAKSTATDMVSDADHASERLLRSRIAELRPDDGVLGEEGATTPGRSGLTWVVDPLDGTTNYLYRYPQWAVSVACEDSAGPVAGCVIDATRGEVFTAARGDGATLNGAPIRVSGERTLSRALIGTGFAYDAPTRVAQAAQLARLIGRVRDVRRAGSAALDLAWVAAGRLDGFYETGIRHWDWAAGRLLVLEAGGRFEAAPGPLGDDQVVTANWYLYQPLAAIVNTPLGT